MASRKKLEQVDKVAMELNREADAQATLTEGIVDLLQQLGSHDHVASVAANQAMAVGDLRAEAADLYREVIADHLAALGAGSPKGAENGNAGPVAENFILLRIAASEIWLRRPDWSVYNIAKASLKQVLGDIPEDDLKKLANTLRLRPEFKKMKPE